MFKNTKYRLKVIKHLLPFTKGVKRFFIINFFISIIVMILTFVNPLFYKIFIDKVILSRNFNKLIIVIAGYLGIFLINVILSYIKNYANYSLVNTTLFRAKLKIWNGFFKMPFPQYETMSIGDMKMRLDDDTNQISNFAGYQTIDYFISILTIVVGLFLLFITDWRLALFSIVAIPLTFIIDNALSKKEKILQNGNRENDQKLSSWLHASVQGWREVKALNLGKAQEIKFVHFAHNFALYFAKWINYWTARILVIPRIKDEFLMQFGLYFLGGLLIINGNLKISTLLVFAMYYQIVSNAVKVASSTNADLQANSSFTDRLIQELDRKQDYSDNNRIKPDNSIIIEFNNVCFSYPNTDCEVLHDFNLTINKGERVAIVGKSGSGKTTILKLITGMISPTQGTVSFSKTNLNKIDLTQMYKRIGFVMQENTLFNSTIRDNLLYGKENATDDELIEACKKAFIYEYIDTLPDKLDTLIGEKGIKLSGGQRQRIILARQFLRNVDIFIFDEATSALDQYSENIVYDAIRNIAKDKTIIIVAHRESSISLCDRKVEIS